MIEIARVLLAPLAGCRSIEDDVYTMYICEGLLLDLDAVVRFNRLSIRSRFKHDNLAL